MNNNNQKETIKRWLDLQILAHESKRVMAGKLELCNLELSSNKEMHIYEANKVAKALEIPYEFKPFGDEARWYVGFTYRGYWCFSLCTDKEKTKLERGMNK